MDALFQSSQLSSLAKRQERVFMILASTFLGTVGIVNILGLSRFVDLSFTLGHWNIPMILPLGVLPYPITFLCTDLISEFYGKARANAVVWAGLYINIGIVFILWLGGALPPTDHINPITQRPDVTHPEFAFFTIRFLTINSVIVSMVAYLIAQFLDVYLFHYWKDFTQGKHLWLRNNASTLVSQFIDTIVVISLAYYLTGALPISEEKSASAQVLTLIICSYSFKAFMALLDTLPFYLIVFWLRRYFDLSSSYLTSSLKLNSLPN